LSFFADSFSADRRFLSGKVKNDRDVFGVRGSKDGEVDVVPEGGVARSEVLEFEELAVLELLVEELVEELVRARRRERIAILVIEAVRVQSCGL
jgi:hypothetical protein